MAYSRFRDRSGLVTRRRVIAYLQRERERMQDFNDPGDNAGDNSIYLVNDNDDYYVNDNGDYYVIEVSNAQASLI